MTKQRREIVQRLREEGCQAARDGKHVLTNPYSYADASQWWLGYLSCEGEFEEVRTMEAESEIGGGREDILDLVIEIESGE